MECHNIMAWSYKWRSLWQSSTVFFAWNRPIRYFGICQWCPALGSGSNIPSVWIIILKNNNKIILTANLLFTWIIWNCIDLSIDSSSNFSMQSMSIEVYWNRSLFVVSSDPGKTVSCVCSPPVWLLYGRSIIWTGSLSSWTDKAARLDLKLFFAPL